MRLHCDILDRLIELELNFVLLEMLIIINSEDIFVVPLLIPSACLFFFSLKMYVIVIGHFTVNGFSFMFKSHAQNPELWPQKLTCTKYEGCFVAA